ncbi:MAG: ETC complex I subunit [Alphaproteobacteria bacterium]|nr:ETC complex I subunit [Alphaproteobacteria bacterium]
MLARIYRPAKTAMQSGKAGARRWVLEFEPSSAMRPDALMGWASSTDTSRQVRMTFDTREQAIAFARENAIPHQVIEPHEPVRALRSYSDNFAFHRKEPWSH